MNLLEEKINHLKVKLASKSPRRHELLTKIIKNFEIVKKEIIETYPTNLEVDKIPKFLANLKAESYILQAKKNELYITADTIVIYNNQILGKPKCKDDAYKMLRLLSGKSHYVYTGVSLLLNNYIKTFSDSTKVSFYKLRDDEIKFYVDYYEPLDKSGSYGIQEWLGYVGIKKIEGDFFNVMGLPLHKLYREIEKIIEL